MVDDQPGKLLSYEAILGELGENLIKATSGREALEQLLRNDIAVVLMDVSMPEIDGFELADMIRQHPRFQKTAIIFISAVHLTDLDRLKGYRTRRGGLHLGAGRSGAAARQGQRLRRAAPQDPPARNSSTANWSSGSSERTEELRRKRRAVPYAGQLHSATGVDGRRRWLNLLVQPALV